MTVENLRDNILSDLTAYINIYDLDKIKDILNLRLGEVKIEPQNELACVDDTNEYYLKLYFNIHLSKKSKKTAKVYAATLKDFLKFTGNKSLLEVRPIDIECYLAHKRKTNNEISLNNYKRNLSAFYSWMVQKRFLQFNPCSEVESYKEVRDTIDYLEVDEMERLRNACTRTRDRAMIEFLRCTGARIGEVVPLKVCDVDFNNGELKLYGEKVKEYRWVFLDRIAMLYLKKYIEERNIPTTSEESLFVSLKTKKGLTISGFFSIISNIGKSANFDRKIYPHLFRKTMGTNIVRRGGTIEDAGILLGHHNRTVTSSYYVNIDKTKVKRLFDDYVAIV